MDSLHELTPGELGRLFPIILVAYDPAWKERFGEERDRIWSIFGETGILGIEHIGSTAVPGLIAKPSRS
jgi:GrpB-like predicted nucleotidyltransferase (UPF0157 family)